MEDQVEPRWQKSSYSGNGGGDCVEVALNLAGVVAVRDSKDPNGPVLMFDAEAWQKFISHVRRGNLDMIDLYHLAHPTTGSR